jgi:transposase-like protein
MNDTIAAKARAAGVEPFEYILGRLESGEMVYEVAREMGGSETMLRRWCYQKPQGRERWREALAERSHSLVEKAVEVVRELKGTEVTKEEIALTKLEVDQLNLIARAHNRPVYGNDQQAVAVQVNFGDQLLGALRIARTIPGASATPLLPSAEPDVETVVDPEVDPRGDPEGDPSS